MVKLQGHIDTTTIETARDLFRTWMQTRPAGVYQSSIMFTEATRLCEMIAAALDAIHDSAMREAQTELDRLRNIERVAWLVIHDEWLPQGGMDILTVLHQALTRKS